MTETTSWIWQSPAWPNLTYDASRLASPLKRARIEYGRLLGKAETLGAEAAIKVERDVWSDEAMATALIEGERLNLPAVRSSVARRLGLAAAEVPASRDVEGLLDVMQSAAAEWDTDLNAERLCRWQAALFPAGGSALRRIETGRYRTSQEPMQIVSGPSGRETVHYVAPPSAAVRAEVHSFLEWFNRTRATLDGIVRAGLAHVWFESIHPFADGNGRVGRAIADMALAQDARAAMRLHGLSSELRRRQTDYYEVLNQAQRGTGDVTAWLVWFAETFAAACDASAKLMEESLVRARYWSEHRDVVLNQRQIKVLNKMLDAGPGGFAGGLTQRKYIAMTGISSATAFRDIEELHHKGMLARGGAGRATHYSLAIPGWEWKSEP